MITDVKACAKRLEELRATIATAEKAQARLDADREAHARTVAVVDARDKALHDREREVALGERILRRDQEELAVARRAMTPPPTFIVPNGITREPYTNG